VTDESPPWDLQRELRDGSWKKIVQEALDEVIAGERPLRMFLIYSALSSQLSDERLHNMMVGDSQMGKSFLQLTIARSLFPSILMTANSLSSKAIYYKADAEGNPEVFKGKLFLIEEAADLPPETRAIIKQMTSNGADVLENMTVDENRKFKSQKVAGMPVIWTNSHELFEDVGSQLKNRFFKTHIDETNQQDIIIERFQKERMAFGPVKSTLSEIPHARALVEKIMEVGEYTVINLFIDLIEQARYGARNRLPMFHALVSAITYANRFSRVCIVLPGYKKCLLATVSDNLEAINLWSVFTDSQNTGLPPRLMRVFEALEDGEMYSKEDATAVYNAKCGGGKNAISTKTMGNYLSNLSDANLVTTERRVGIDHDGREYTTRELIYRKMPGADPTTPQLDIRRTHRDLPGYLDARIERLREELSQLPDWIDHGYLDDVCPKLLDADLPPARTIQTDLNGENVASEPEQKGDWVPRS